MAINKMTLAMCLLGMLASAQCATVSNWRGQPFPVAGVGASNTDIQLTGTVKPKTFKLVNGKVNLVGQLEGSLTKDAAGNVESVDKEVSLPLTASTRSAGNRKMLSVPVPNGCDILNLAIDGISLDLLGLVVVLQPVQLDIVAVPGAGNLLGNLLCAVAGLLDNTNLTGLVSLLNNILKKLLGGLSG